MPTTLYNIINKTHPLLDISRVSSAIEVTEADLRKASIIGLKDNEPLRKKIASVLGRYVSIKHGKYLFPLSADDLTGVAHLPYTSDAINSTRNQAGENYVSKDKVAPHRHRVNRVIERWRKMIVSMLVEAELLDTKEIHKSKIITEYGFSEERITNLLATSDIKSRTTIRDDLYVLMMLADIVGLKIEISHE